MIRSASRVIAPARGTSPLERLAAHFHQDCKLLYATFESGVSTFLQSLSPEDAALLSQQLTALLKQHPGKSATGLANAWLRLGAQVKPWGQPVSVALQAAAVAAAREAKRGSTSYAGKA